MGNPQERPPLTPEFVAGLIVGEGHIGLTVNKGRGKGLSFHIVPQFSLHMEDTETMRLLMASMDAWGLAYYVSMEGRRIDCRGLKRVDRFLRFFRPHLTGDKARAADIVRRLIDLRLTKPFAHPYEDAELELVAAIRQVNAQRGNAISAAELKELHARKRYNRTACSFGHPLTPQNTYRVNGRRRCRECAKLRQRRYRAAESSETARSAPA